MKRMVGAVRRWTVLVGTLGAVACATVADEVEEVDTDESALSTFCTTSRDPRMFAARSCPRGFVCQENKCVPNIAPAPAPVPSTPAPVPTPAPPPTPDAPSSCDEVRWHADDYQPPQSHADFPNVGIAGPLASLLRTPWSHGFDSASPLQRYQEHSLCPSPFVPCDVKKNALIDRTFKVTFSGPATTFAAKVYEWNAYTASWTELSTQFVGIQRGWDRYPLSVVDPHPIESTSRIIRGGGKRILYTFTPNVRRVERACAFGLQVSGAPI